MPTRRQYLASAATVGGLATLSTTATAVPALPAHITADTEGIERYQPMFHNVRASLDRMIGLYGWQARSDQWDYEVY